jgi:hypothetical protein
MPFRDLPLLACRLYDEFFDIIKENMELMARLLRAAILLGCVLAAGSASAGTYYIAANGSDSNTGTSKTSPWLHAPGMAGCAGNCASYRPVAGDQFLFRGGDTWHYSAGSPMGLPWTWTWSGSSGNNIYVGVDQTWYSGGSFARPILTMDNPLSSTLLSGSCTYDDTGNQAVVLSGVSYVTFDDFEFTGKCWSGDPDPNASLNITSATHSIIKNNYFHGWSATTGALDVHRSIRGMLAAIPTYNEIAYNVIDGQDSSSGASSATCKSTLFPCQSGFGVYGDGYNFHHNILRYLSNGIVTNGFYIVHDNLFEQLRNTFDGTTHPNVIESGTTSLAGLAFYFYNNVVRNTLQNVTMWVQIDKQAYIFNNVFFNNYGGNINCLEFQPATTGSTPTLYFFNNTLDTPSYGGPCTISFSGNTPPWKGTSYFENNHLVGIANFSALWFCQSGATCTSTNDNGSEVYQTESVANGQGYTSSNDYAPTAPGNATVGAGANLTSSCATFSFDNALCNGTSLGVIEQVGQGGYIAVSPAIAPVPRPANGSWNAGAYEYGSGQPNPPTGLTAVVE